VHVPALLPDAARAAILAWFDERGRQFPFRGIRDPYAIWVCETMAQQTQIARAAEKWSTFLARFPTVDALAAGPTADVLRAWRGLGYNRRALNLQRAAQVVMAEHGGRLPTEVAALERLPGIGPYTARAIAALAFGQPVGPVDTNVRRVLTRMLGGSAPPSARQLQQVADLAVPHHRPADWTHAVMDLGASVCLPRAPRCAQCPVREWCAFASAAPPIARPAERRRPGPVFAATSRWLRGRLMDLLRDAPGDDWTVISTPVGVHDEHAVRRALRQMAVEGLVEEDDSSPLRARLPAI
jgi:A/G-specific adenine glycosylase